jgi:HK97 gp10 family phage protein
MIKARWTGLDQALRNVSALGEELAGEEVVGPALVASGKELRDEIVRTAPRSADSVHMADTFVVKMSGHDKEFGRTVAVVGPKAGRGVGFIAPFVEFGTSTQGARPFIRPAFDAFQGWFPTMLVDHMQKQFNRVVRKYNKRATR